jgi:hypothetical protein
LLFVVACGGSNGLNPNAAFVTKQDKDRIDVLLARAKIEFDRAHLDKANSYASEAYNRNPHNQLAAQQFANIKLALAKLSLLDVASRISQDLKISDSSSSSSANNTQALDVLGVLADVVGVSEEDFANMGTKKTDTVVPDSTNPTQTVTLPAFKDLDVIEPKLPGSHTDTSSPRYKVLGLRMLNEAIALLCPFVNASVTSGSQDVRHQCTKVTDSKIGSHAQVLFSFAMAHLFEALYFNAVLNYSNKIKSSSSASTTIESSNLFKRVQAVQAYKFDPKTVEDYINELKELVTNINSVFDVNAKSMLQETMVDLSMTSAALGAIEGFPPSMLAKIQGVQKNIQSSVDKAGKSKTNVDDQTKALKAQLSTAAITKFNDSVTSYINSLTTPAQKADQANNIITVCNSYNKLVETFLPGQAPSKPKGCP